MRRYLSAAAIALMALSSFAFADANQSEGEALPTICTRTSRWSAAPGTVPDKCLYLPSVSDIVGHTPGHGGGSR